MCKYRVVCIPQIVFSLNFIRYIRFNVFFFSCFFLVHWMLIDSDYHKTNLHFSDDTDPH